MIYRTSILPSQLDAWLKVVSSQHPSCWLRQAGWRAAGPPISLSCASPARRAKSVSIQQQPATFQVAGCFSIGPECATTSAPPTGSKACFAADLSFKEIHFDAWASNVMAGAGGAQGAAGPAPDVHQPPGKTVIIDCNYCTSYNNTGSEVVAGTHMIVGSNSDLSNF